MNNYHTSHLSQRKKGVAIAELPPALIILFLIAFFPIVNLCWFAVSYGGGWYLNFLEAREVSFQLPIEAGGPSGTYVTPNYTIQQSTNWRGFMGVTEAAGSPVVAQFPSAANASLVGQSTVKTTVTIKPFLPMPYFAKLPWLSQIPGLGTSITCIYYTTVVQEEQGQ